VPLNQNQTNRLRKLPMLKIFVPVLLLARTAGACSGLSFNLQQCGLGGQTVPLNQNQCYQGTVYVKNTHGSSTYASTMTQCNDDNHCAWRCYSDDSCNSAPTDCAPGYDTLTCNCIDLNYSWTIRLGQYQVFSWQGVFTQNRNSSRSYNQTSTNMTSFDTFNETAVVSPFVVTNTPVENTSGILAKESCSQCLDEEEEMFETCEQICQMGSYSACKSCSDAVDRKDAYCKQLCKSG